MKQDKSMYRRIAADLPKEVVIKFKSATAANNISMAKAMADLIMKYVNEQSIKGVE